MARPRKYADKADKQRAYRWRKYAETLTPEDRTMRKAQIAHEGIARYARHGDEMALQLLGDSFLMTALKVLAHLDVQVLRCAHEQAVKPVSEVNLFAVKSE
jgi:ribosomal protein L18E